MSYRINESGEARPSVVIDPRWVELVNKYKSSPVAMRTIGIIRDNWSHNDDISLKLNLLTGLKDLKKLEEIFNESN